MGTSASEVSLPAAARTRSYPLAFILVTSLFFMWGLSYGLLDVLNKHFQETLGITRARSAWLQGAYFGAYFLMAMPAAALISRRGYKFAILTGLALFASGALLVIPSTLVPSFTFFLCSMFIIASGLAFLETAANPYVTLLGDPAHATRRLNLSQSFNGLGQFVAPLIAANALFSAAPLPEDHGSVRIMYVVIAIIVMALAFLTWRTAMPSNPAVTVANPETAESVWSIKRFRWGVFAQFCYVAAQVGVGAFFINYVTETHASIGSADAARLLSVGLACFLAGRFVGTALMTHVKPARLLTAYGFIAALLSLVVVIAIPRVSLVALIVLFFFMSIMFPTIFALALEGLGERTAKGASYLIMSIVGGAIVPYFMGLIGDVRGIEYSFVIPVVCFLVVAGYGWGVGLSDPVIK